MADIINGSGEEHQALLGLLAWYRAMGADEAVADVPLDAFTADAFGALHEAPAVPERASRPLLRASGREAQDVPPRRGVRPQPAQAAPPLSLDEIRQKAKTLAELEALITAFDGCALKRTATRLCFARGSAKADVMLIGEAPGRDEDRQGKPFVGRAGQLLDKMLAAVGLDEQSVYITNTVYWRPPGNRTPTPEETEACAPFLAHQIALVKPKVMVLLGGAATKAMLQRNEGIMRLRGKWHSFRAGERDVPALATLHPAYLLRTPAAKRQAWQDLLMIKAALQE